MYRSHGYPVFLPEASRSSAGRIKAEIPQLNLISPRTLFPSVHNWTGKKSSFSAKMALLFAPNTNGRPFRMSGRCRKRSCYSGGQPKRLITLPPLRPLASSSSSSCHVTLPSRERVHWQMQSRRRVPLFLLSCFDSIFSCFLNNLALLGKETRRIWGFLQMMI